MLIPELTWNQYDSDVETSRILFCYIFVSLKISDLHPESDYKNLQGNVRKIIHDAMCEISTVIYFRR